VKASSQGTGGRIIFVSATAHYTGVPSQTHVSAAKAAIDVLSNNVAIEFGPWGITSNIIAPGTIANTEVRETTEHVFSRII
jgi:2,4-dienoyl-CoA reductase [(3E)-enoyl-CoA-producing], peroxisomal